METVLRFGFDFDGVIADCTALKLEQAYKMYNVNLLPERAKEHLVVEDGLMTREEYRALMHVVCGTHEVGLNMKEIEGAISFLRFLSEGNRDLIIVTSREDKEVEVAKEWLRLRGLEIKIVSSGYKKDKIEALRGFYFYIDDDLIKLQSLLGIVPRLFLLSNEHNKADLVPAGITRIESWEELKVGLVV